MLLLNAKRNGYSPEQCGKTMTVGDLINYLEDCNPEDQIFLSHDRGYTYGSITTWDFEESEEAVLNEAGDFGMGGLT
jgi:hypothetical protein